MKLPTKYKMVASTESGIRKFLMWTDFRHRGLTANPLLKLKPITLFKLSTQLPTRNHSSTRCSFSPCNHPKPAIAAITIATAKRPGLGRSTVGSRCVKVLLLSSSSFLGSCGCFGSQAACQKSITWRAASGCLPAVQSTRGRPSQFGHKQTLVV